MANPAQSCDCSSYLNLCCCGTQNGITVVQPQCQNLPDGSTVTNPAFVLSLNTSFWTYKFLTDCDKLTRGISGIGIPICAEINAANITVEEKIDGCGRYISVPFELITDDPNFGPAPDGLQFLKITSDDRYDKGVSVEYRISIIGDYPYVFEPISVKAATVVYEFGCEDCFIVPGCAPDGKLLVSKECETVISNNQASFKYEVNVDNIGGKTLASVQFEDIIVIPSPITIGAVSVNPPTLSVDTSVKGQVKISGILGNINPGGRVTVTYSIPVVNIESPGRYLISNMARSFAAGTESSDICGTSLDAVKLSAVKCCAVSGNTGTFNITVSSIANSPDVTVNITDFMRVPAGVTVQFSGFNGCEAYYAGTLNPIPLNTDISGPIGIDIFCKDALIPSGGSFIKSLSYRLVSSKVVGISTIMNTITDVAPVNIENIIYEGTENLPAIASINVELAQNCAVPCEEKPPRKTSAADSDRDVNAINTAGLSGPAVFTLCYHK